MSKLDRALLSKYLRPQWPRAVLLGVLLFAGIGSQLANPQIAKTFIDQAQAGEPFERLVRIALLFLGVALLTQVATVLETYVADDLGWRTTNVLRADLTRHVLSLDGAFHAEHGAGRADRARSTATSPRSRASSRGSSSTCSATPCSSSACWCCCSSRTCASAPSWRCSSLGAFVYVTRGGGFVGRRARETPARRGGPVGLPRGAPRRAARPEVERRGRLRHAPAARAARRALPAHRVVGDGGVALQRDDRSVLRRRDGRRARARRRALRARRDHARRRLPRLPLHRR